MRRVILFICLIFATSSALAQDTSDVEWTDPRFGLHVPQEKLRDYSNPDGSCVQCSNGMAGTDMNVPEFASLLWDSEYGDKVRGGSNPSRVADYARERNVRIYNVTGKPTWEWMLWAAKTGRSCAIGAGRIHFQTLKGYDPVKKVYLVVNNNGDQRIQEYDEAAFRKLHLASVQWCVILDYPPAPAPPELLKWWE